MAPPKKHTVKQQPTPAEVRRERNRTWLKKNLWKYLSPPNKNHVKSEQRKRPP